MVANCNNQNYHILNNKISQKVQRIHVLTNEPLDLSQIKMKKKNRRLRSTLLNSLKEEK